MRKVFTACVLLTLVTAMGFSMGQQDLTTADDQTVLTVWEHTPQFELPLKNTLNRFMELNPISGRV